MTMSGSFSLFLTTCLLSFMTAVTCISPELYDDFVHYFRYTTSAYAIICPRPNGQTSVKRFHDFLTDARGFVARDDTRHDIVVSFAGSLTLLDIFADAQFPLRPFISSGIDPPNGTLVHKGFLKSWNAIASIVLNAVESELQTYSGYNLIITGHSMGGAVASLAAISLKTKFPSTEIYLYTYGQPRTGNDVYAQWINEIIGDHVFRIVHGRDWVPNVPPRIMLPFESDSAADFQGQPQRILDSEYEALLEQQYRHHGIEYWQNADPPSPNTTIRCSADGEDPNCSNSLLIRSELDHTNYFGILSTWPFCL